MRFWTNAAMAAAGAMIALAGAALAEAAAPANSTNPAAAAAAPSDTPADLALGGDVILRLRSSAGGMSPQQRVDEITSRLSGLLGTPNIKPSDVVVYAPPGKAPEIYALGRKLITVDAATARAAGGGQPLALATSWAKRLQQVLPRVNYRPSNAPEPVIPPHPPLLVTGDLSKVGGAVGAVTLRGKVVIRLHGVQAGGVTATERADAITVRLKRLANGITAGAADPVQVAPAAGGAATITVGGTPLLVVAADDAKAAGAADPSSLAGSWAKNIRAALGLTPPAAAAAAPSTPATPPSSGATPATPSTPASTDTTTPPAPTVPAPADTPASPPDTPAAPAAPAGTPPATTTTPPAPAAP